MRKASNGIILHIGEFIMKKVSVIASIVILVTLQTGAKKKPQIS